MTPEEQEEHFVALCKAQNSRLFEAEKLVISSASLEMVIRQAYRSGYRDAVDAGNEISDNFVSVFERLRKASK